jgi:hypothetical protein
MKKITPKLVNTSFVITTHFVANLASLNTRGVLEEELGVGKNEEPETGTMVDVWEIGKSNANLLDLLD